MRKIILAAALIAACASPVLAMTKKVADPGATPVPAGAYEALVAEKDAMLAAYGAKAKVVLPEVAKVMTHMLSAEDAVKKSNNAAFQEAATKARADIAKVCAQIGGC